MWLIEGLPLQFHLETLTPQIIFTFVFFLKCVCVNALEVLFFGTIRRTELI